MLNSNDLHQYFEKLVEEHWALVPVDLNLSLQLLNSAKNKLEQFRPATVTESNTPDPSLRSDRIFWLDASGTALEEADRQILQFLEQLKYSLRDYLRLSLTQVECHFSVYRAGQHYVRHRDSTKQNNKRQVSFVIYLNDHWQEADGGQLVAYQNNKILFKINPNIGQMILFKSDLEHEVLTAKRTRFALTGWFRQ